MKRAVDIIQEKDFQATVVELARLMGWRVHAQRPAFSRGKWSTPIQGNPGWPDLYLVRDGHALALELKSQRGKQTNEQAYWLRDLGAVPGVEAHLFRPSDMERIKELLA